LQIKNLVFVKIIIAFFAILSAVAIKLTFGSFYLQEGDEEAKSYTDFTNHTTYQNTPQSHKPR